MLTQTSFAETTYSFSTDAPQLPERRSDTRQLTIYRVGVVILDGGRELCLIRNISAGGVMIHAHQALCEGQRLAVEFKADVRAGGTVIWIDDPDIGIKFDQSIDVEEILASDCALDSGWQSRRPRIEVDRMGILRAGSLSLGVSTLDISQGGVKLEIDHHVEIGSDVVLTLDGFRSIHGVVRWSGNGSCGVSFNQLIPFRELMGWVRPQSHSPKSNRPK